MATALEYDYDTSKASDRWDLPDVLLVPMDSLDAYFFSVHEIPLLSAAQERELGLRYRAGDTDAALSLAVHNLRYAAQCARKWEYYSKTEPVWSLSDAVQAANSGLWHAATRFNPDIARFTTYATNWIFQGWQRERATFFWQIRLPAHAVQEQLAFRRAMEAWEHTHHQEATAEDLVGLLGWSLPKAVFWLHWAATQDAPLSLDMPRRGDEDTDPTGWVAQIPDDHADTVWDVITRHGQKDAVDQVLGVLKPREADVLRLRYGFHGAPMTLQEVGEVFKLTRERIRQIEAKALKKCRVWSDAHPEVALRDWLSV